jgi:TRAP-type C4-dicarboxylate transport system permease small subunit
VLRLLDRLITRFCEIVSVLYLLVVFLTAYEVFSRYILNAPTIWVHDLGIFLTGVAFIFGGPYALRKNAHVRLDVVRSLFSARTRAIIARLNGVFIAVFLALLVLTASRQAEKALAVMETSGRAWDVPIPTYFKTALAVGAAVFLVEALIVLFRREDEEDKDGEEFGA